MGRPVREGTGAVLPLRIEFGVGVRRTDGINRWSVEDCASVFSDELFETANRVAFECDGAVVVHDDGTIASEMVRAEQLTAKEDARVEDLPFADWMGARHMSALETTLRPEVDAVLTLSETDGRTTIFRAGRYEDHPRDPEIDHP